MLKQMLIGEHVVSSKGVKRASYLEKRAGNFLKIPSSGNIVATVKFPVIMLLQYNRVTIFPGKASGRFCRSRVRVNASSLEQE